MGRQSKGNRERFLGSLRLCRELRAIRGLRADLGGWDCPFLRPGVRYAATEACTWGGAGDGWRKKGARGRIPRPEGGRLADPLGRGGFGGVKDPLAGGVDVGGRFVLGGEVARALALTPAPIYPPFAQYH